MNDESGFIEQSKAGRPAANTGLLADCFENLGGFVEKRCELRDVLRELGDISDDATRKSAARLKQQLDDIEPSVTMIGQVKAGKTSLVNAMVGWPELLPADVNPWTSVVTSLHISPKPHKLDERARFRFFETDEWERLLNNGGRLGELARRAGADGELEKVREQIEAMRQKSKTRLGKRFELLLGQSHAYDTFDEELVERYVCLGDEFGDADDAPSSQGRFAEITKSADLYLQRSEFPMRLCIRDTPGVNDTFMMREQITIGAIRDSRICVVVLSAHQALSSVDLALIRIISNIKSRHVIIFVNRIDELADPTKQTGEIEASIKATLEKHDGPKDAQIVFGSAYWANHAISGTLNKLSKESADSLLSWAEASLTDEEKADEPLNVVWKLSGVPALYNAIGERIAESEGKDELDQIARSTANLANGIKAANDWVASCADDMPEFRMDRATLERELQTIVNHATISMNAEFDRIVEAHHAKLDRSHRNFLERATSSLIEHLEKHGEGKVWSYEPTGLRLLLRSAYQLFGAKVQRSMTAVFEASGNEMSELYRKALGADDDFAVAAPILPRIPPPVVIGQTIALDMKGSWWRNWWKRRRGYKAYAQNFYTMIMGETDPIVDDLKGTQVDAVRAAFAEALENFLNEQKTLLLGLLDQAEGGKASFVEAFGGRATEQRLTAIRDTMQNMTKDAA